MDSSIGIIVVFYNPTEDCVSHFMKFARAGFPVAIADNGIKEEYLKKLKSESNIYILGLGVNVGLAAALNNCIKFLIDKMHVSSVVLFDQDSKPKIELPIELEKTFKLLQLSSNPACVGPHLHDKKMTGKPNTMCEEKFLSVKTIATSGTYISSEVLRKVGLMKDDLFIDCIDHEWCFRARNLGLKVYVDQVNVMEHDMGENGINWFGKYKPVYKSPVRHYYIVRNTIYMLKLKYIPLAWRFGELLKLIRRIVFYIIFSNEPKKTLKNISKGIVHGLSGRLGAID